MKLWTMDDRYDYEIGGLTFRLSPLSYLQISELRSLVFAGEPEKAVMLSIKYSVKEVIGLEKRDGSPYELQFEKEILTDKCLSDLLRLEISDSLQCLCAALVKETPDKIAEIEGVKFLNP